jgi:hypothetical protein
MLTCDVLASIRKKQKIVLAVIMSCLREKASNMHPNMAANIKSLRNKHNHVETHHRDLLLCHKLRSSADNLFFVRVRCSPLQLERFSAACSIAPQQTL